jgi:hypothetical protein
VAAEYSEHGSRMFIVKEQESALSHIAW